VSAPARRRRVRWKIADSSAAGEPSIDSGVPWCSAMSKPWKPARSAAAASSSLCS